VPHLGSICATLRFPFRSLDEPDRVRGLTLAWFWLDEATLCGHYTWQVLKGRLRQRGYPQMGWATGTPQGRDGYAYDFELALRPNHTLYRAATQENAANLPPDYIADLGLSGAFYDQEVLGLFTAFEGLVYTLDASEGGNVADPPEGKTFSRVIGGVDWGYTNPTATVIFGIDGDERAWQLDEHYQRRAPLDAAVIPALLDLTRRYNVRVWRCGPDEPEHIRALDHALAEAKLPCRAFPANNAVRPGIQTITRLLARREDGARSLYISPRCVHTLAEYASYQYDSESTPSGKAGMALHPEQPLKQNDHLMDACFIADTLVETINGPRPIEQIHVGEYILTKAGYRRVLSAGMTHPAAQVMRVTFSNGSSLIGTPNHPVYVKDVGFIALRSLQPRDIVLAANEEEISQCDTLDLQTNQKSLSIETSLSGDMLPRPGLAQPPLRPS
jgi:hypothetical protein